MDDQLLRIDSLEGQVSKIQKTSTYSKVNQTRSTHHKSLDLRARSSTPGLATVHIAKDTEAHSSGKKVKNLTEMNHWDLTELRRSTERKGSQENMPPKL